MSANDSPASSSSGTTRKERRAAERAARKGRGSKPNDPGSSGGSGRSMVVISIVAVVIGVIAVAALIALSGGLGSDDDLSISEPDDAPAAELRQGRTLVAPDAVSPVIVEAFEDPQCVHCGTFTKRIEPLLIAGPVKDGTASFTYNDFIIFGEESLNAAVAMRVAEEMDGKFWDFQNILFHNQAGVDDGSFSRPRLADMAEMIGLDREEFLQLMDEPRFSEAVAASRADGALRGVSSTPSVFVNGELISGVPTWEDLEAAIEAAAAEAPMAEATASGAPAAGE
jgi:protein-disulfide isomerase